MLLTTVLCIFSMARDLLRTWKYAFKTQFMSSECSGVAKVTPRIYQPHSLFPLGTETTYPRPVVGLLPCNWVLTTGISVKGKKGPNQPGHNTPAEPPTFLLVPVARCRGAREDSQVWKPTDPGEKQLRFLNHCMEEGILLPSLYWPILDSDKSKTWAFVALRDI